MYYCTAALHIFVAHLTGDIVGSNWLCLQTIKCSKDFVYAHLLYFFQIYMMSGPYKGQGSVACRPATETDYKGVIDINENIYGGEDYIPSMYFEYLKDPERHLFLAEFNGKVVCYPMKQWRKFLKWMTILRKEG